MKKAFRYSICVLIFMSLFSCISIPFLTPPPSATPSGPRTIILNGEKISEEEIGGFISWYCQDYINGGPVLIEVGYFENPKLKGLGFILFDGGYTGEITSISRTGVDYRWDWGPNETDYSFVIEPDGTGLYYDFTAVKPGKSIKAREVYQCHKRFN